MANVVVLRSGLALAGVLCALGLAEGGARLADGNAFPFLAIYAPDARYGVRLLPDATARVRSRTGHVTEIHTNALGFRGATVPAAGGVLLLGDSQVFGYGVDDDETMAALLSAGGVPTLAVAVPSWGPEESARAAEELVPTLRPRAVVFFANLGNDWLEAEVPNVERSDAHEGWLVRRRKRPLAAPAAPAWLRRSHLWFTVRALEARMGGADVDAPPTLGAPAAERMLAQLADLAPWTGPHRSRLTRHLRRVEAACAGTCRVVIAILPLDVQVDAGAWAKYGRPPRDVRALDALGTALLADAPEVAAVDLRPALVAASPGAYLDDDPHLSAHGHEAVARALRPLLQDEALARREERP